jgi:simple sugar transport system permease protein
MGLLTVSLGANQHVSGLGMTIALVGLCQVADQLLFTGSGTGLRHVDPFVSFAPFAALGPIGTVLDQQVLTWLAFLVVAPASWWVLGRTRLGLSIRAVGENPEAADAAGISVAAIRYVALIVGGALMAVGGAFLTLGVLGSFTPDIVGGRGWVCIALVIFGRWRIGRGVLGALIFAGVYSLALRLQLIPGGSSLPPELLLALPYLAVIAALAISGRNVAYPGAYLKPYRRS